MSDGSYFQCFAGPIQAADQPLLLLLLGYVQEELDHRGAVARQVPLEGDDVAQAFLPEVVVHRLRRQLAGGEQVGVDAQGDRFLVVGTVEDADPATFRQRRPVPLQPAVFHLLESRAREIGHPKALRIDAGRDVLDGAVFAGGVHALEYQQQRLPALSIQSLLQAGKLAHLGGQQLAQFLGAQRRGGRKGLQRVEGHGAPGLDAKLGTIGDSLGHLPQRTPISPREPTAIDIDPCGNYCVCSVSTLLR